MKKALQHLELITVQDDYETPKPIFKDGCNYFDHKPKLDVCGTKQHHKTARYFTKDALKKQWKVDFWCNPPYSEVAKFIEKGFNECKKHHVNGLFLVYAKTDTQWFHKFVQHKAKILFVKGRIKFWINGKEPRWCKECKKHRKTKSKNCSRCGEKLLNNPSPYPSMFVFFKGRKTKRKTRSKRLGIID